VEALQAAAAGRTDVDYFGDAMAPNGGEHNRRHSAVNYAVFEAGPPQLTAPAMDEPPRALTHLHATSFTAHLQGSSYGRC
jgi:hypothetical protein